MATTTPDNIYYNSGTGPQSIATTTAALASSVQSALSKRQRYSFVWPSATERGSQTGMTEGSTGYQIDTKTEYIYESSQWRLKLPFASFTGNKSAAPNTVTAAGSFSLNSSLSTSSTFVIPGSGASEGMLTFKDPGIYSVSWLINMSTSIQARAFIQANGGLGRAPIPQGEDTISLNGTIRTPSPDTTVYFTVYQNGGNNLTFTTQALNVARLG